MLYAWALIEAAHMAGAIERARKIIIETHERLAEAEGRGDD